MQRPTLSPCVASGPHEVAGAEESPTRTVASPRRGGPRLLGAMAAVLVAAIGAVATGTDPVAADTPVGTACAPGVGVTVVVDFTTLGGGIRVGCAPGEQPTGFAALTAAGFAMASGPAAGSICTIDGLPTEGYPYCWLTGGYWSYWKKARGGSWGFSGVGGGAGPVPVDAVEGWSWAGDFSSAPPRADEDSVPPPTTTTTTTTAPTTTAPTTTTTAPSTTTSTEPSTTSTSTTEPTGSSTTPSSAPGTTAPTTGPGPGPAPGAGGGAGPSTPPGRVTPTTAASPRALARTGLDPALTVGTALAALAVGGSAVARSARTRSGIRR